MQCKINCSSSCDGRAVESWWHNLAALGFQYLQKLFDVDLPVTRSVRLLDHLVDTLGVDRLHHAAKFVCGYKAIAVFVEDFEGFLDPIVLNYCFWPHLLEPLLLDLLRVDSPALRKLDSLAGGSESRSKAGECTVWQQMSWLASREKGSERTAQPGFALPTPAQPRS